MDRKVTATRRAQVLLELGCDFVELRHGDDTARPGLSDGRIDFQKRQAERIFPSVLLVTQILEIGAGLAIEGGLQVVRHGEGLAYDGGIGGMGNVAIGLPKLEGHHPLAKRRAREDLV